MQILDQITGKSAMKLEYEYVKSFEKKIVKKLCDYIYKKYAITEQEFVRIREILAGIPKQKYRAMKMDIFKHLKKIVLVYQKMYKYCMYNQDIDRAKEYKEKIKDINRVFYEVDERKYKKDAMLKFQNGMKAFNEINYEVAYYEFENALELWKLSYEKTKKAKTLWILYQKSNEIGNLFYENELFEEAEYFFKLNYSYTQLGTFGDNDALYKTIVEISEKNLHIVERKLF